MTKEDVAIRLKELRKRTGLSQPKFAKYLDMSYKTYTNWEQGNAMPKDVDNLLSTIESKVIEYENSNMANSEKIGSGKIKKRYYNNGVENIMLLDGEKIPEGFVPGMVKKSKEERDKVNAKRKKTNIEKYGAATPLQSKEILEKTKQTNLERYGVENVSQAKEVREKVRATMMKKYGGNPMLSEEIKEKIKKTNIERYGVENTYQAEEIKEKIRQTNRENLGVDYPFQSKEVFEKGVETFKKKYGVTNPLKSDEIKERVRQTNREKYGVDWQYQRPEVRKYSGNSKPNRDFEELLKENDLSYGREFALENYYYDFKVGGILIEIDPSATHNTEWNPFGRKCIDSVYHKRKSEAASRNGYRCIHVFDWDDKDKIVSLLKKRDTVYARKCKVREVSNKDTNTLLKEYHLQGTCRGQEIRLGLYCNNELVSIMTFGVPRYNKKYQYELLRYCSIKYVIGGAEKLFKHFIKEYKPESIISYCDNSKFDGDVYNSLGFRLISFGDPSRHWYSSKEKRHITDNLLRQRGYDKLFKENHGKGTSNEKLIIDRGYVPVYDCGQATYVWSNE